MGYFFSFLSTSIIPVLASFIGGSAIQALLSVGIGVVTYNGMSALFDVAMQKMITEFNGLPSDVVQLLGLMGVDTALNIMFSAAITLLTIKGMSKTGALSRQTWRGKE